MSADLHELANALCTMMAYVEIGDYEDAKRSMPRVKEALHRLYSTVEGAGGVIDDRPARD